jgi:hypothetical protein
MKEYKRALRAKLDTLDDERPLELTTPFKQRTKSLPPSMQRTTMMTTAMTTTTTPPVSEAAGTECIVCLQDNAQHHCVVCGKAVHNRVLGCPIIDEDDRQTCTLCVAARDNADGDNARDNDDGARGGDDTGDRGDDDAPNEGKAADAPRDVASSAARAETPSVVLVRKTPSHTPLVSQLGCVTK